MAEMYACNRKYSRLEVGALLLLFLALVAALLPLPVAAPHPLRPLLPRLVHLLVALPPLPRAAPLLPLLRPRARPRPLVLPPPLPRRRA